MIKKLLFLLALKLIVIVGLINSHLIPLAPDEAQYWTWSQALDWGYYSKPPAVAWQIFLSTFFLGNTELGVRAGALMFGFIFPLLIYFLAKRLNMSEKQGFWAALIFAFSPMGVFLSFAATTDLGMTFFLLAAILALIKEGDPPYLLAGLFIMLGALFKWTAFIFWPVIIPFLFFYPRLRRKSLFLGVLISLLALLPSLYWNITHDFATFKHVYKTVVPGQRKGGNFFDFLGAQIALLSPIFFGLLLLSFISLYRSFKNQGFARQFCLVFSSLTGIYFFFSFFQKMQPNWALYLYPPGIAFAAYFAYPRFSKWLHVGLYTSLIFLFIALSIPAFQPFFSLPYAYNPFRQNMGWPRLTYILTKSGYNTETDFLFGESYQMASILSFYSPGQKRAYFFNLDGRRKNQFSYWPQVHPQEIGQNGYFVISENVSREALASIETHYLKKLAPYFDKVELVETAPLHEVNGKGVKYALIFKGFSYNGASPQISEKY